MPIDVGENLEFNLEGGERVVYELIGGIHHDGGYDELGQLTGAQHYFAILKQDEQHHIVNQILPITQSENGLSTCQIFMYRRLNLPGLADDDFVMN